MSFSMFQCGKGNMGLSWLFKGQDSGFRRALAASIGIAVASIAAAEIKDFTPVTDAMLQNPAPEDWLNWRRTLDGWGFSPLKQINTENAHQLQVVWARTIGPAQSEPTPLVYKGVMYIPSPAGVVQAFDAVTGDTLWEFRKKFAVPPRTDFTSTMRSLAIYRDKIYVNSADAHIIALDARTGTVAWDHTVADEKLG